MGPLDCIREDQRNSEPGRTGDQNGAEGITGADRDEIPAHTWDKGMDGIVSLPEIGTGIPASKNIRLTGQNRANIFLDSSHP